MDICLESFSKYLRNFNEDVPIAHLKTLLECLETQKLPAHSQEFSIGLFLSVFQKDFKQLSNETLLSFLLLLGDFSQKNLLLFEDKQKLEIFTQISLKLKNQKPEINNFYETFIYLCIHMSLTHKFFPELQDFNDIHKKIKTKIQEDIRFYNKFIENFIEFSNKLPFPNELCQILDFFLDKLAKIIKKTPVLFKNVAKTLQANFTKILSKSAFSSLFQNSINCFVFLSTYTINQTEKISENLIFYLENLKFLFRLVKNSQESFEEFDEKSLLQTKFFFEKEAIFLRKNKLSFAKISEYISIISRILRKTLKNLPENEAIKFEILLFLKNCEEILVSDQNFIENLEKDGKKNQNFLTTGLLEASEYLSLTFMLKKEILKILSVFCQIGKGMLLKYLDWFQNAIYFVGTNYRKNLDLFATDLQLLKNCIKIYQTNFAKFTRNFLMKNPDLLNILVNSVMVFAGKTKKKDKNSGNVAMVLSKKAKEKKNKIMNVISLNESIKQVNPFEYLQGVEKKTLNKFIIKALKVISTEIALLGRFEVENSNILRYEEFFNKSLKILYFEPKTTHLLKFFLIIGENLLYSNKIKGENLGFSLGKFDLFLEKFLKKPVLTLNLKMKIFRIKQKIQDLKSQNKVTYINSFNNSMILNDYLEQRLEISEEIIEENPENPEILENLEEKNALIKSHNILQEKPEISKEKIDFNEEIPEFSKEIHAVGKQSHHGLDFIDSSDKFPSMNREHMPKTYGFEEIAAMPKINLEED